jgi:hypothetical protein
MAHPSGRLTGVSSLFSSARIFYRFLRDLRESRFQSISASLRGGGTNFDTVNPGTFAAIGKQTTDTQDNDPHVMRLGSLAYTFAANPGQMDWQLLGYGGLISSPTGGTLKVMVVDTAYWNNTGGFTVTVNDIAATPEPSAAWLAFSGIALVGLVRSRIWRRR